MSRAEDIIYVEQQLRHFIGERQTLADGYTEYHKKIAEQIEKVLRDAGVWDVVQALEAGREARRVADQERANQVSVQITDLEKVKAFLLQRDDAAKKDPLAAE